MSSVLKITTSSWSAVCYPAFGYVMLDVHSGLYLKKGNEASPIGFCRCRENLSRFRGAIRVWCDSAAPSQPEPPLIGKSW